MNSFIPFCRASAALPGRLFFAGLVTGLVTAQAQPITPNASNAAPIDNTVVELSPFEVNTDQDTSFGATESFVGGRLKSDLRDTPATFQVLTSQFLEAVGATNLQEASLWATNTTSLTNETAPGGAPYFNNNPVYLATRGSTVGGGTTGGSRQQRNYFPQFNDGDSYNLERFDFGRGPNSILFGNGTIGGVSSALTKQARTDRAFQTVSFTVGSWARYRGTIDVNQPLSEKVAVRVAGVYQDAGGWRHNDMDDREGLFTTFTLRPFKDTEIRIEGEYMKTARQMAVSNMTDRFSGWDGVTTFNAALPLPSVPSDAASHGYGRENTNRYVYDPLNGLETIFNYRLQPITQSGDATASTPIAGFVRGSRPPFNVANADILYQQSMPDGRFENAIAGSAFTVPTDRYTQSPDGPMLTQYFRDVQVALTQRIGEFYVEVAADYNLGESKIWGEQVRGTSDIFIDINEVLPDGSANPNFLQPYGQGRIEVKRYHFEHRGWRAAVAWRKDLGWVNLSANVLGGVNERNELTETIYLSTALGTDTRFWGLMNNATNPILVRRYFNATSRPLLWDMAGQSFRFYDSSTNTDSTITPRWIHRTDNTDAQKEVDQTFNYGVAAVHAKFWKEKLVLLAGIRSDEYIQRTNRALHQGDYPTAGWDGLPIWRPDAPADYWDLTYQPLDASGNPLGPREVALQRPRAANGLDPDTRYLDDRFQSDFSDPVIRDRETMVTYGTVLHVSPWFNPFFNYAESFNPNITGRNLSGGQLEANRGTGFDTGVRAELLDHKLNIGITYYQNQESNFWQSGDGNQADFNSIIDANIVGDLSEFGRNNLGYEPINQYRDTVDRDNSGWEVDMVYSPARGFRIMGNYGKPTTGSTNRFPHFHNYWAENESDYRQMVIAAGGTIDGQNVARVDTTIPASELYSSGGTTDAQRAVNGWNGLQEFIGLNPPGQETSGEGQATANFFADYTMQEGRLKGLRLGAGVQWRGRRQVGNRGNDKIPDPNNPNGNIDDPSVDANTPVYNDSYQDAIATLGYTWKLRDNRTLSLNLRVKNLLNETGARYINNVANRPPDGDFTSTARVAVPIRFNFREPRSFELTCILKL